ESNLLINAVNNNVSIALFKFFEFLPLSSALSLLGVLLITTFFITSADSGVLVITTLVSPGKNNQQVWQKILWSTTITLVACALLFAGGLSALQTMTILTAFPVLIVILTGAYCLIKSLQEDTLLQKPVQHHNTALQYSHTSSNWKERIKHLITYPQAKEATLFINNIAWPALQELKKEINNQGITTNLEKISNHSIALTIKKEEVDDFYYEIRIITYEVPEYADVDNNKFCRLEVFLLNGGQDYDIFGYTDQQIIADVLTQYEKHIHFLPK
ncbi:MAG: BCCT family transporter, partial [Rickettsiaceae bacterium]